MNMSKKMKASLPIMDIYLVIEGNEKELTTIYFAQEDIVSEYTSTSEVARAKEQLADYLAGKRKEFALNLVFKATPFQKKAYDALLDIAYGTTKSYADIAQIIGNDKAYRAVGLANNKNPFVIVVPCHRVIGKNNSLVGFAPGIKYKEALLALEQKYI